MVARSDRVVAAQLLGGDRRGLAAGRLNLFHHFVGDFRAPLPVHVAAQIVYDNLRPLASKGDRNVMPDPASGPGDDCGSTCE